MIEKRKETLLLAIETGRRYNQRRAAYFNRLTRCANFVNLLSGTALFTQLFVIDSGFSYILSGLIVGTSLASIAFQWSDLVVIHNGVYRDYTDAKCRLIALGDKATEGELNQIDIDLAHIEKYEPAGLKVLLIMCHNEACNVLHRHDLKVELWPHQEWLSWLLDAPPYDWERHPDAERSKTYTGAIGRHVCKGFHWAWASIKRLFNFLRDMVGRLFTNSRKISR